MPAAPFVSYYYRACYNAGLVIVNVATFQNGRMKMRRLIDVNNEDVVLSFYY